MVNLEFEKQAILRKHQKVYAGGNKIYMGGSKKYPKKVSAQVILDNPEVLRKSKNPFPFEGEILDAPDMPEIVKELTDITPKKETEKKAKKLDKADTKAKVIEKKFTREELEKLSFGKLKKLAKKFGETGRSKAGLIKDILKNK